MITPESYCSDDYISVAALTIGVMLFLLVLYIIIGVIVYKPVNRHEHISRYSAHNVLDTWTELEWINTWSTYLHWRKFRNSCRGGEGSGSCFAYAVNLTFKKWVIVALHIVIAEEAILFPLAAKKTPHFCYKYVIKYKNCSDTKFQ